MLLPRRRSGTFVVSSKEPEPALAAPGLGGPVSILKQPISGPRASRRKRNRPYAHVHLEIDLGALPGGTPAAPALERLEQSVLEGSDPQEVDLVLLIGHMLHALSARRFRRIDHWEVAPGGWLPPAGAITHDEAEEPVGQLLKSLESGALGSLAAVRSFAARLSDLRGNHVDVIVRRVGRIRRHAISLDLWGLWTPAAVDDLTGSLASRLPVTRSNLTKFQYA
jgi:hypothetical protein